MKKWHQAYWNTFNTLGRVIGALFLLVGLIMLTYGFTLIGHPQAQSQNAWLIMLVALLIAVCGLLSMLARPYKPKGCDETKTPKVLPRSDKH